MEAVKSKRDSPRVWDICVIYMFYLFLFVHCPPGVDGGKKGKGGGGKKTAVVETEAVERLSKVFGIDHAPRHSVRATPPQFMLELFSTTTDSGGLARQDGPYNASTIVSFPDRGPCGWERTNFTLCFISVQTTEVHLCRGQNFTKQAYNKESHFYYNVSMHRNENLLESEFHLFRMSPKVNHSQVAGARRTHVVEVKVYQVLDPNNMHSENGRLLLGIKRISAHFRGWVIFNVTKSVKQWIRGDHLNHGFLVISQTLYGDQLGDSEIRFAQRKSHHDSKQPILVIYTDDGRERRPHYISPADREYKKIRKDIERMERKYARRRQYKYDKQGLQNAIRYLNEKDREEYDHPFFKTNNESNASRKRRSAETTEEKVTRKKRGKRNKDKGKRDIEPRYSRHRRSCSRRQMYVDFDEIGWSGWIISPKGYNAYHCKGECPFPLGQSQRPTNHATVQSIVHALRVGKGVTTPCCVPNKLYSISLLYFDDSENVILKQYDDMVAASCGCH